MTIIRAAATFFILVLLALAALGWVWTGAHQPASQMMAARLVLGLSAAAGIAGLVAIWRWPPRRM